MFYCEEKGTANFNNNAIGVVTRLPPLCTSGTTVPAGSSGTTSNGLAAGRVQTNPGTAVPNRSKEVLNAQTVKPTLPFGRGH